MKRSFVWIIAITSSLLAGVRLFASIAGLDSDYTLDAGALGFVLATILFSLLGGYIVVRTNGNRVGWLMLLLGFILADPFRTYIELHMADLQGDLSFGMVFAIWTQGWFFFVVIFAVFLILLHFPNGRPPSSRWNLVSLISLSALGQYILVYTFQPEYGDVDLLFDNPIALLPVRAEDTISGLFFGLGLIFLGVSSLVSIFVRFRRADPIVRAQIKWLLFAGVISFSGIGYRLATYDPGANDWTDYILVASLLILILAIAVSILRYRLFDIDLIIRRTLQYALLSGNLALVFYGGVVVLQGVFQGLVGNEGSPLVTVLSTLLIAALFNPLRVGTQNWVDRRFYRSKYDAEQALTDFAKTARDEVDMQLLTGKLIQVVTSTMQPEKVRLLLKNPQEKA